MNTKSEFISRYVSKYKVVCVLKKIIISDFAEINSVPFSFLLKIVSEFQSVLGYYYYFIIIGCM
jgi:hypothetical protein